MRQGIADRIKERRWRWTNADDRLLGNDFILSEIRRARRFNVPFSVAYFSPLNHPSILTPHELADRIFPELREFDYVAVNEDGTFVALWMFGTPRDGAETKAQRLKASPTLADVLRHASVGIATFPDDGMTYEALMDAAEANAATTRPHPSAQSGREGAVLWQPRLRNTST
jgi:hypothetical protein